MAIIEFDHVWKKFRTGQRHDSLRDLIPSAVKALGRRDHRSELGQEEFWALEGVSFAVNAGEALGIIGPNGAGKSTTLKILTRILRPNRGRSAVTGRVGALIEIAAGFHPDLTGRENVYLQGAVMGMKRAEVAARFDEIVDFAGVGAFIDTQIKRYSSGMNARLGFSIAAHLNATALIIDEVLSVGDMAFQERCVARMRQFKRDGAAIVFVSHNLQAVSDLCDSAVFLQRKPMAIGATPSVIDRYVRQSFASVQPAAGTGTIAICSTRLRQPGGRGVDGPIAPGKPLRLEVDFETFRPLADLNFAFRVVRATDQFLVYDAHFSQNELEIRDDDFGRFTIAFDFHANLTRGQYYFDVFAQDRPTQRFLARMTPAGHLTIAESRTWGGVADLDARGTSH